MSRPPRRFGEEVCQLREKKMEKVERKPKTDKDLYDVEVVEVDTTRKQLKIPFVGFSHECDEMCDYDNKRNYFPFVRLEKMFLPKEGSLDDRGNILHGQSLPDSFSIFSIMCARADSLVSSSSSSAFEMV